MTQAQTIAKALVSALTIFVASLFQAADHGLSTKEWLGAIVATLASGVLVFYVPNKSTYNLPDVPGPRLNEGGQGVVGLICTIIGIIMIIVGGYNLIASALANVAPNLLLDIILIVIGIILIGVRYYDFNGRNGRSTF